MPTTTTPPARTYVRAAPTPYTAAMAKRRILGAEEARARFSARIDAAENDGEHTIVLRRSRPAVAIVPADWYHRMSALGGDPWEDWEPPPDAEPGNTES